METLAYLYFTESYEESDLVQTSQIDPSAQSQEVPQQAENTANGANMPPSYMRSTGYDPKLETQPTWMTF
ncbi:MAG TPA: hypothetical protein V6C78_25190 [Crinalium sp.]|jgi:hypothetical protein